MAIQRRVKIVQDSDAQNPRTEWDTFFRMLCFHDRYNLGDKHNYDSDDLKRELACEAVDDLEDELQRLENDVCNALYERACNEGIESHQDCLEYANRLILPRMEKLINDAFDANFVALPLSLHDHSGISMSVGRASGWDCGQVGIIVATKEQIKDNFNGDEDKAIAAMTMDVEVYDAYLRGSVWGFVTEFRECAACNASIEHIECDPNAPWMHNESCWGYYGDDHTTSGLKDAVGDEYADLVDDAEVEYA